MNEEIFTDVIEISEAGEPDVLTPSKRVLPPLKANELLIKTHAAGVNRPDVLQRKGLYPPPKGASDIPGLEVAGVVEEVGGGVSGFNIGDEVMALVTGGGYATHCIAPIESTLPKPQNLSFAEAAAIPETFYTVWNNVFIRGKLEKGEAILIHGGTSGIGTTAIMLAKAFGATVLTTCGSDEKCEFATKLGADFAINYKIQDFEEEVLKHTDGQGVDVVLDMVAGDYVQKDINILKEKGRLLIIAALGGAQATLNMVDVMRKQIVITGSALRPSPLSFKQQITNDLKSQVLPLLESDKIKPQIYKSFNLNDASKAHALMESSEHMGKITLDCS